MQSSSVRVSSYISGTGFYVPPRIVDNNYFAGYLETSDEWIRERTGIIQRHWAEPGVSASDLAEPAARTALAQAGIKASQLSGIIVATSTPDYIFPSTACMLQSKIGAESCFAFDMSAACSGFIYALQTAEGMLASGRAEHILVVCSEVFSSLLNHDDRSTVVLFGDGAGAVVLSRTSEVKVDLNSTRGIYASAIYADGNYADILCVPQGSASPITKERLVDNSHKLIMAGREVFKLAVRGLAEVSEQVVRSVGLELSDIDWYVSHQANKRILDSVGKHLNLPAEKILINVERYGNTSAATIPILLAEAEAQGTIKKGDLVILSAFGGGLTWGATLVRW